MIIVWVVIAAVFLVVELVTVAMVSIWFLAGALAALLAAALGAAFVVQLILFLIVSALCFVLLYPRLKHFVRKNNQPTNADMVVGQTCVVTTRIDNIAGTGAVTVDGKTWTARTADGETVEAGSLVRAESIQGVKLIVSPVDNTPNI